MSTSLAQETRRLPRATLTLVLLLGHAGAASAQILPADSTEVVTRVGVYGDNDRTRVIRSLVAASTPLGKGFTLSASVGIDSITSASIDVRASPFIDSVSSASPGLHPRMNDQRNQYDVGGTWTDGQGTIVSLDATVANEIDYLTVGGALRAARDFNLRNTTLLGGLAIGRDIISSVVEKDFQRHLTTVGYSAGLAQVLGTTTAIRVRYDGGYLRGYQASPYRAVRYGGWAAVPRPGNDALLFVGASAVGEERLPFDRVRHAGTVELVQSLASEIALAPSLTVGHDDWGLTAQTAQLELRVARPTGWRFSAGYRFYHQGPTDFYRSQYTGAPSEYTYATADKKLGTMNAHSGTGVVGYQILSRPRRRVALAVDVKGEAMYYTYPGFLLLDSKTAVFVEIGARLNF